MTLAERLSKLRKERADLMDWIAKSYPHARSCTKARHRLTIITAQVLATEAKLNRRNQNVSA
jgi:hypothetical protein